MGLNVISYNCQSAKANSEVIAKLLKECDILLLQETFLLDINKHILDNIDADFSTAHTSAVRKIDQFYGRSSGGLAILWRKTCKMKVFPVYYNDRIMGIKIEFGEISYLLINIYLNCDYGSIESLIDYKDNLAKLANFINSEIYDEVLIAGDFNCDPSKGRFFSELEAFSSIYDFKFSSIENLDPNSFTFVNRNQVCGTSWLDHVITSNDQIVDNFSVLYGYSFEDHIPIKFNFTPSQFPVNIDEFIDKI